MSYVSTVAAFINARAAYPAPLSAEDYTTIAEWEKQEIPLGFVLDSLDQRMIDLGSEFDSVSISDLGPSMGMEFADWLVNQTSLGEGH